MGAGLAAAVSVRQCARPDHGLAVAVSAEERLRPAWVSDDEPMPDPSRHDPLENFVAGAVSTTSPFAAHHPAWALPAAVKALAAVMEWEPDE